MATTKQVTIMGICSVQSQYYVGVHDLVH